MTKEELIAKAKKVKEGKRIPCGAKTVKEKRTNLIQQEIMARKQNG